MFCLEMYFRKIKLGITSKRFCACNNENGIMSFRMQSINQILMLSITYFSLRGICCNFCLLTLLFNSKNKPLSDTYISFLQIEITLISICLIKAIQRKKRRL